MTFSQLGLAAPLLKAVEGEGYTIPTPIQVQAIPAVMTGSDLLGIAQTGTGKTAAFALPILHRLAADRRPAPRKGCRVLVLSPTRELASQIAESFETYGRHQRVSVAVVFGGVAHRPQIQALSRGVDVLVATPGRLIDHLGEGNVALGTTEIFVLDEADQMLDLGFFKPIRQIVGKLPQRRQSLFFSATMPREIAGLADDLLRNPVKIAVAPVAATADRITQRVIHVEHTKKRALLVELLADPEMARTLVFARTKRGADRVARHLEVEGLSALAIHGNKSQKQRQEALSAFKTGKVRTLIATDIAARGIDIDSVSHVVNFELPDVPEAYVHRIGRTARAGAAGKAISFCDGAERDQLRAIERLTGQSIPSEDRRNDASIVADASAERPGQRRNGGQRGQQQSRGGRDGRPANGSGRHANGAGSAARSTRRAETNGAGNAAKPTRRPEPNGSRAAEPQNGRRASEAKQVGSIPPWLADGGRGDASHRVARSQIERRAEREQAAAQPRGGAGRNGGNGSRRNPGRASYQSDSRA